MDTADFFDRYLGVDADQFTPPMAQAVLAFSATDEVKNRVRELAVKANLGSMTPGERAEYERYIMLDELMAVLKSRAQRFLSEHSN